MRGGKDVPRLQRDGNLRAETPDGVRQVLPPDLGLPESAMAVSYVANLREDKAHLCLVEAAKTVVAAVPEARFLLVGREDREAAPVRARIRALGLERHVVLTGSRKDVARDPAVDPGRCAPGRTGGVVQRDPRGDGRRGPRRGLPGGGESRGRLGRGNRAACAARGFRRPGFRDPRTPPRPGAGRDDGPRGEGTDRDRFSLAGMVTGVEESYIELLEGRPLSRRV